jgi:hypothetical protein
LGFLTLLFLLVETFNKLEKTKFGQVALRIAIDNEHFLFLVLRKGVSEMVGGRRFRHTTLMVIERNDPCHFQPRKLRPLYGRENRAELHANRKANYGQARARSHQPTANGVLGRRQRAAKHLRWHSEPQRPV